MTQLQLINFTANFVSILKNLIIYAIIIRVIFSWFNMGAGQTPGGILKFLNEITDPFINLAKKIPHKIGMIDLSPLIALFAIDFIGKWIVILLYKLI